ncbi:hypothetical protein DL89DRAFT_268076 [Linderina pennispora]|uniref:Expansin-like EG45 domain-containing protein n=1 Tax=Linderina pennispora TaxID=61395 RepID=A0A1Y1W673_9FUNG|nr:uncharacterized protein DL89DRAFT_268076 [Linderina pennispora]ORX69047.1 hypothetical protein DL89DRAFT_268076 [Linderina pennispora]
MTPLAPLHLLLTFATLSLGSMIGSQSITPHDYQSLGNALAISAPSCGYPYATLDISRITAVQKMNTGYECGTCLRVETDLSNYIEYGETVGLPGVAMATHFEATTTKFEVLPTTSVSPVRRRQQIAKRADTVRYVYVLAVDTGGLGLDMAQVSFTALFGQSMSPMPAVWFPVDGKYCSDIWRNSTKKQMQVPTSMRKIPVRSGPSQAPADIPHTGTNSGSTVDAPVNTASSLAGGMAPTAYLMPSIMIVICCVIPLL